MEKVLPIDKPVGISSFDVIRRLRRKLGIRKMGHAGTLDPLASGLMLIGVGEGTKQLADYLKLDKEYVAEILIGVRTETGDLEGAIVEEKPVTEAFSPEHISAALTGMIGTLSLPVSAYSAIKQGGVPLYRKARQAARRGESITDVPIREMKVYEAECLTIDNDTKEGRAVIRARFKVGSGTYIRSLGEELGRRLGYPATLQNLRRTKIGEFRVEDAEEI